MSDHDFAPQRKRGRCRKVCLSQPRAERIVALCVRQHADGADHRQEQRAYYCRWCEAWHVTSKPNRYERGEAA